MRPMPGDRLEVVDQEGIVANSGFHAYLGAANAIHFAWHHRLHDKAVREKMAQYLSTQGLTLDRFEVLGSLSSGKAPFYGFALAGKKVGE